MEQPSRKPRRRRHSKSQREAILEEYRVLSIKSFPSSPFHELTAYGNCDQAELT